MKKTFKLSGVVTISIYTTVEAESLEEAIEIAEKRDIESYQYKAGQEKQAWVAEDYDGLPCEIRES